MISEELRRAREYEASAGAEVKPEERPVYHLSPRIGWLNDPNGFSFYDGQFHLFYQYHPYNTYWGPMHWGHAVSSDLIKWEYLPAVMAPDTEYDGAGCFSGSAAMLHDGRQMLMYTGCSVNEADPDGRWVQTQCVAFSETSERSCIEYVKHSGNPVITSGDLPQGGDPYEFRDPYIWEKTDGGYSAVLANACTDENSPARILKYSSPDGSEWSIDSILFEDFLRKGSMWECPCFFPLDGRYVLTACLMDMKSEKDGDAIIFPEGNNACYVTGIYDPEADIFTPGNEQHPDDEGAGTGMVYTPVDYGLDFYAPQVLITPDGRRIMIGWMQDPHTASLHDDNDFRIFGLMTIPRELALRDNRLIQQPARELDKFRREKIAVTETLSCGVERSFDGISGRVLDMEIDLRPAAGRPGGDESRMYEHFSMKFAVDGDTYTELRYDRINSIVTFDRTRSGIPEGMTWSRSVRVRDREGELSLRIFLDRTSSEVFINGGEQVMSAVCYTHSGAQGISFSADGNILIDITKYDL